MLSLLGRSLALHPWKYKEDILSRLL